MATPVFTIEPNPHWVIIDNFSKLPDGAAIYTYRSLDPSTFKPAFQDAAGTIPYGQPIVGFGNGTMPPIFWEFDPNNPTDTYYIRVYDSADPTTQQFLWDFNGLSGGGGGGGGGTIITAYNIENLVVNNIFFRNIGNQAGSPSLPTLITLAPSNNAGFVGNAGNASGSPAPDIIFAKNNTTSTDQLNFTSFTPLGIHALPGGQITPEIYVNYQCTGAGAGETYKYVQFPIYQGLEALSSQPVTVVIYARCNSGDTTLNLSWRLFFGDGGAPSADILIPVGAPITLNNTWQVFTIPSVTPDATGGTAGSCGNGGLFLQVNYPLSPSLTNIDFIKPAMYLGTIAPGVDFVSHDEIDAIVNSPRTGDVRVTLNNFMPYGWVPMNDGTIGDAASNSTTRANIDTFPLFSLIWNLFVGNQALAPMFTAGAVPTAYGASAVADFTANRQISLTLEAGRVMAGVSGSHLIGTTVGAETHTLVKSELPDPLTTTANNQNAASGANFAAIASSGAPGTGVVANSGGNQPHSIMQPTVYMNVFIKL